MKTRFRTYSAYSIGCAAVWVVILIVVQIVADSHKQSNFRLVFLGWVVGWVSASIARIVYPPPKLGRSTGTAG
jgi:hypothetical protein